MSSSPKRIPNTSPERQKEFVLLIAESLDDPASAGQITKNNLEEASNYIEVLKGTPNEIKNEDAIRILIAQMPQVPTHPPGYFGIKEKQREFVNSIKPNLNSPSKKRKIPSRTLNEIAYYAERLGNKNVSNIVFLEKMRRATPPFRIPEMGRPNMPEEARKDVNEFMNFLLVKKIYNPLTKEVDRQNAYHKFVDVFLTDWVDRKGFVNNNGSQMHHMPFFDDYKFLDVVKNNIRELLKLCEETPNPKTLNHLPHNSTRQQLLKELLTIVTKRQTNLLQERLNKLVESEGGKRRTRKRRHAKRRYTRRN
jgi:hypothetical protein